LFQSVEHLAVALGALVFRRIAEADAHGRRHPFALYYDYTPVTPLAGLLALYGGDFTDKISLSQSDRKVNEPWIPCN